MGISCPPALNMTLLPIHCSSDDAILDQIEETRTRDNTEARPGGSIEGIENWDSKAISIMEVETSFLRDYRIDELRMAGSM